MADQSGSGLVAEVTPNSGAVAVSAHTYEPFHGRPVSWVAVSIIMIGFLVGGLGLVFGPMWAVFWAGAGLVALGGLLAMATGILNDWY